MNEKINQMLKDGIIKKSKNLWTLLIILVSKKDESIRFYIDYKKLNIIIIVDTYLLLVVNDTIDKIKGKKYYIFIDLASRYWQVEVDENS